MLVLTRKSGERIVIGDNVTVTVLEIRGGVVKLGLKAPPHVSIHRKEIHAKLTKGPSPTRLPSCG